MKRICISVMLLSLLICPGLAAAEMRTQLMSDRVLPFDTSTGASYPGNPSQQELLRSFFLSDLSEDHRSELFVPEVSGMLEALYAQQLFSRLPAADALLGPLQEQTFAELPVRLFFDDGDTATGMVYLTEREGLWKILSLEMVFLSENY